VCTAIIFNHGVEGSSPSALTIQSPVRPGHIGNGTSWLRTGRDGKNPRVARPSRAQNRCQATMTLLLATT